MSGWGGDWTKGLNALKNVGDQLANQAREFEASLAQPLVSTPPRQPQRPGPGTSPSDGRRDSPSRASPSASTSSAAGATSNAPPPVAMAVQSASQLADSALSSLRMSLRKGRASLDSARKSSFDVVGSPTGSGAAPATPTRSSSSIDGRRGSPAPSTPTVKEESEPFFAMSKQEEPTPTKAKQPTPLVTVETDPTPSERVKDPVPLLVDLSSTVDASTPASKPVLSSQTPSASSPLATSRLGPSTLPTQDLLGSDIADDGIFDLLRPKSPDAPFTVFGTADVTPEGPSRIPTPFIVSTPTPKPHDTLSTAIRPSSSSEAPSVSTSKAAVPHFSPALAVPTANGEDEDDEEEGDWFGSPHVEVDSGDEDDEGERQEQGDLEAAGAEMKKDTASSSEAVIGVEEARTQEPNAVEEPVEIDLPTDKGAGPSPPIAEKDVHVLVETEEGASSSAPTLQKLSDEIVVEKAPESHLDTIPALPLQPLAEPVTSLASVEAPTSPVEATAEDLDSGSLRVDDSPSADPHALVGGTSKDVDTPPSSSRIVEKALPVIDVVDVNVLLPPVEGSDVHQDLVSDLPREDEPTVEAPAPDEELEDELAPKPSEDETLIKQNEAKEFLDDASTAQDVVAEEKLTSVSSESSKPEAPPVAADADIMPISVLNVKAPSVEPSSFNDEPLASRKGPAETTESIASKEPIVSVTPLLEPATFSEEPKPTEEAPAISKPDEAAVEEEEQQVTIPVQAASAGEDEPSTSSMPTAVEATRGILQEKHEEATQTATLSMAAPSKEYEELQALKATLNRIVAEVLPSLSNGIEDPEDFERELKNLTTKTQMSMSEVARLTAQLSQQKERMEEVRDTHRLEGRSQSDQVTQLNAQLTDKDATLKTVASQLSLASDEIKALKAAAITGTEEYDKLKVVAKEEEEKRTKALSLLRALRQKLVKAEKDREEADKSSEALKVSEAAAQETLKGDRARFDQEVVSLRAAQELQLNKLRQSFDREVASLKAQHERETSAKKGQYELDAITVKSVHQKELGTKDQRIAQLEGTVKEIRAARDGLFDQLQMRTAEAESSSAHQESLQSQTGELQYELKDARDRAVALQEELEEMRKARRDMSRDDSNSRKLLVEAEQRHEAKVRDLEARAQQLERDRLESDEEMGRNLQERLKEVERMRQQIVQKDIDYAQSVHLQQQRDAKIDESESKRKELDAKVKSLEAVLNDLREELATATTAEAAVREELSDRLQRATELEQRLEEVQIKESSLRSNNKILREELRKLQSGVLLSEKQRQPGVGYFASYQNPATVASSSQLPFSSGDSEGERTPSRSIGADSAPSGTATSSSNGEEAVNFEYLRNVILQFLERPDMRPHLLSVLGVILHFTPAEARRLAAKAG